METNRVKKTLGRRKIEIRKIEKKQNRQVTFTKRRMGLFRKAGEIGVLCGAEMAILVRSPAGKVFAFGNPSPESVISRFLNDDRRSLWNDVAAAESTARRREEYAAAVERRQGLMIRNRGESTNGAAAAYPEISIPDDSAVIDDMDVLELEEYLAKLESLQCKFQAMIQFNADQFQESNLAIDSNDDRAMFSEYGLDYQCLDFDPFPLPPLPGEFDFDGLLF